MSNAHNIPTYILNISHKWNISNLVFKKKTHILSKIAVFKRSMEWLKFSFTKLHDFLSLKRNSKFSNVIKNK